MRCGSVQNQQIASLSKQHLLKFRKRVPNIDELIRESSLPCHSVASVLRAHSIAPGELFALVVDAEGHDSEVLDGVDWSVTRPLLLVYEKLHLSQGALARTLREMGQRGYRCNRKLDAENVWCTRTSAPPSSSARELLAGCNNATAARFH
jgi:hypothetical protein